MSFRVAAQGPHIRVAASGAELDVLRAVGDVVGSVGSQFDDPARDRLFPPPYGSEEDDREYHRFSHGEIEAGRSADLAIVAEVVERLEAGPAELTPEEAEGLARAVGTARIVVAARNGMFALEELPRRPVTPQETVVAFLGAVQDDVVQALLETLP